MLINTHNLGCPRMDEYSNEQCTCVTPPKQSLHVEECPAGKEKWEKEFDEKFVNTLYSTQSDVQVDVWSLIDYGDGKHLIGDYYGPNEIKDFISTLLQKERAKTVAEIEEISDFLEEDKLERVLMHYKSEKGITI